MARCTQAESPCPIITKASLFICTVPNCKSKFVCTLGPATSSPALIRELILNGMSAARLNFSHCSHEFASEMIKIVREIGRELKRPVGILLDSNGPKLRTGDLPDGRPVQLTKGDQFCFYEKFPAPHFPSDKQVMARGLCGLVLAGDKIFVDDGLLSFTVLKSNLHSLECIIDNSGPLYPHKGINLFQALPFSKPFLKAKDREDLEFAVREEVEFVTVSCVRNAGDVQEIREFLALTQQKLKKEYGPLLLSKIENKSGLESFEAILAASDGIIIDRGYLGVEIELSSMSTVQKLLVQSCTLAGKPCLMANHVLESMRELPRPNRSEASDIASAVSLAGDGYILSAETAIGAYPVESLQWLRKICGEAETHLDHTAFQLRILKYLHKPVPISESIASSTVKCAREVDASCVLVSTERGGMARLIAKYRPSVTIVAGCADPRVAGQLSLSFGVIAVVIDDEHEHKRLAPATVISEALKQATGPLGIVDEGNRIVVASGQVDGFLDGSSTFMQVLTVGEDC